MINFYGALLALSSLLLTVFNTAILGAYYDAPKRLLLSFIVLIFAFIFFIKDLKLRIPTDPKFLYPLILSFIALIVSVAINKSGMYMLGLIHVSLFLLSTVLSSSFYNSTPKEGTLKSFISIQALSSTACILWAIFHEFYFPEALKPFFGNPNVLSDYLMLAALQFTFLYKLNPTFKKLSIIMLSLTIGFMIYLGSRASLLGLVFGAIVYLQTSKSLLSNLSLKYKRTGIIGSALLLALGGYLLSIKGLDSLKYRLTHWGNTLYLIADNFFGVGAGNFELAYGPYNGRFFEIVESSEKIIVANPHNTFLEIIAEIGILGALGVFTLIYFLIRAQLPQSSTYSLTSRWVLTHLAALGGVALFAFPQDNIYTLFFLSLCFGFALSNGQWKKTIQPKISKVLILSVALLTCFCVSLKAYSSLQTYLFSDDPEKRLGSACALDAENWKACIGLVEYFTFMNELEKAQKQLQSVESRFPDFYALVRARAELKIKQGDLMSACRDYRTYNAYYSNKSSKAEWIKNNCPLQETP